MEDQVSVFSPRVINLKNTLRINTSLRQAIQFLWKPFLFSIVLVTIYLAIFPSKANLKTNVDTFLHLHCIFGKIHPILLMYKQTYKICFCFRRRFRVAAAEAPPDIKSLFQDYSETGFMSVENLRRFLVEIQKETNATVEDAQAILNSLHELKHLNMNIFHRKSLNLYAFFKYLLGDINPPINPNHGVIHFLVW